MWGAELTGEFRRTRRKADTADPGKRKRYRERLRKEAIRLMGGKYLDCGFDDERALEFDHIVPVRRGSSGVRPGHDCGEALYRQIVRGKREGIQLLCANCHAIKTREQDSCDGRLHLNVTSKRRRKDPECFVVPPGCINVCGIAGPAHLAHISRFPFRPLIALRTS
ncbi:5-methylcytosine-specific restriction endonuclease McrA [Bradyrhizobium sp. USDA 3256]